MRERSRSLVGVTILCLAANSFAGKPERDKQEELKPKVADAEKSVQSACGCKVTIQVMWDSYPKADDVFRIPETLEAFSTASQKQCNSPANKKAFCTNLTNLEVGFNKDGGMAELKGKTIKCASNDSSYTGDHQFTAILDKF